MTRIFYKIILCAWQTLEFSHDQDPKRALATEVAIALHRNMVHGDIGSNALSGFGHPALQLGTTYSQIYAHEFKMGLYREEQVRVLLRNPEQMDRPIDARIAGPLQIALERSGSVKFEIDVGLKRPQAIW